MVNKTSPGGRGGKKKIKKGINIFSKKGFLRGGGHTVAFCALTRANCAPPKQKPSYAPGGALCSSWITGRDELARESEILAIMASKACISISVCSSVLLLFQASCTANRVFISSTCSDTVNEILQGLINCILGGYV